jgi:hypothetical protein
MSERTRLIGEVEENRDGAQLILFHAGASGQWGSSGGSRAHAQPRFGDHLVRC